MAGSVNKAILIGNLTRDPECRTMQNGNKVANITVATNEQWKDKVSGERKEKSEFHRVVIFGNLADIAEKYLKKGSKIYVSGSLQTRKWTDKDGVEKYSTEVVLQGYGGELTMLDGKGGGNTAVSNDGWDDGEDRLTPPARHKKATDDMDDEIPF